MRMRRTFQKSIFALILCAGLSTQSFAAAKLFQFLAEESGVTELLTKKGFDVEASKVASEKIRLSLMKLSPAQGKVPTQAEVTKVLSTIEDKADRAEAMKIVKLLDTDSDKVSREELEKAIANLIYIADRHGLSSFNSLSCSTCAADVLAKNGITASENTIDDPTVVKSIEKVKKNYKTKNQLQNFIKKGMRSSKLGTFNAAKVAKEDEVALAVLVDLSKSGTPAHKDVIQAMAKMSTDDKGRVNLLGSGHKMYRIFAENVDTTKLPEWTARFERVAKIRKSENLDVKDAFYKSLEEDIEATTDATKKAQMQSAYDDIKTSNCLFE